MSRLAANSVRAHMPNGWIVNPPMNASDDNILLYDERVSMALSATCINIALQRGTENLESWCNKWL